MVFSAYDQRFITERAEMIERTAQLVRSQELPTVEGISNDRPGTRFAEQGMSLHHEGDETIVGYHVTRVGLFPVAGEVEFAGFRQQAENSQSTRVLRLLGDRIIYERLNLQTKIVPVWSFYFEPTPGMPTLIKAEPSIFQLTAKEGSDKAKRALSNQLGHYHVPLLPGRYVSGSALVRGEGALGMATNTFAHEVLAEYDIPMLHDEGGRTAIHRAFRVWTDFKNQQMLDLILTDRIPLHTLDQLTAMQSYASGLTNVARREDIAPHSLGVMAQELIRTPAIRGHTVSDALYGQFVDGAEQLAQKNDILLVNVLRWARQQRLLLKQGNELRFHNLDSPIHAKGSESDFDPNQAFDAFHKLLSFRGRSDGESNRVRRSGLQELREHVGSQLYPGSDPRAEVLSALLFLATKRGHSSS